jgi:hypothetical protein
MPSIRRVAHVPLTDGEAGTVSVHPSAHVDCAFAELPTDLHGSFLISRSANANNALFLRLLQ